METCDCGARVPRERGPTHAYLTSAPGCWRRYGELTARLMDAGRAPGEWAALVDCYAAQHPGGIATDRRQRQSVAVHLVALCLLLELGVPAGTLARVRQRVSAVVLPRAGLTQWPALAPPGDPGVLTAVDLHAAADPDLPGLVERWPHVVWQAWGHEHERVRGWAALVAGGRA